jgi:ATP-dependent exoDNAse (exonuclease V) beta subunit
MDSNMVKTSSPQLICAGGRSDPEWILRRPKKAICDLDPLLTEEIEKENAAHCFDSLCVLYVAMTRARHGLYMVTSGFKSKPSSMHPSVFVKTQLTGEANTPKAGPNVEINGSEYIRLYESRNGGSGWYSKDWPEKEEKEETEESLGLDTDYAGKGSEVLRHREPSKQAAIEKSAGSLFSARSSDVMDFGSAIHEMFEQVEWAESADVDKIIEEWEPTSRYDAEVTRDAVTQFRKCMQSAEVRELLKKPDGNVLSPWIEKRFEVVMDGGIVSGAFDRVIIERDGAGKPVSAVIIDYKSSLVDREEKIKAKIEDYKAQMYAYRDALALILGLKPKDIKLKLLFTKQQVVAGL